MAGRERPRSSWLVLRCLGALAVLAVGLVHLQQYFGPYAQIPTIGTLFLVNFAAAAAISLALLAPLEHLTGRWAGAAVALVTTIGGITPSASRSLPASSAAVIGGTGNTCSPLSPSGVLLVVSTRS